MHIPRSQCICCPANARWLAVVLLACLSVACLLAADIELATLKSGTDVFTNVTVYGQNKTDLFIRHSRGFGNVKIKSLDSETLQLLKLGDASISKPGAASSAAGAVTATVASMKTKLASSSSWKTLVETNLLAALSRVRPSPNLLAGIVAGLVVVYLLFCVCIKLICVNAGSRAGVLIWFPVLQVFPLLRAARMSGWWFVVLLIPLVGLVAHIVWCVNISKACGKGVGTILLLILPVTSLLAFFYLALSNGASQPAEMAALPPRQSVGTAVLGEG